ncbi:MAG TPA: hypothetical protein VLG71_03415, partial [Candidatus Limnocylindria bacterium]|nr:hypothetical protein [Candidatus Limnocylindria bacterium]
QRSSGRQTGSARRAAKRKQAAGAAAQAQQHNAASVPTAPPVSLVTPLVALAALPSTSTHVVSPACAQNDGPSRMVQEQSRALAGAGSSTAVLDLLNKQVGSQEVIKQNRNNDSGSRVQDDFDFLNDVADKKTHAYQSTVLSRDQTIESTVSMLTKKASLYARFEKFRKMAEDSVGELSAEVDPIPPFLKDFLFWVRQRIFPRTYGSNA